MPVYGIVISFQEYDIVRGFFHSKWVGLDNFREVFSDTFFYISLKSTLLISTLKLIAGFPAPIIFALLLNELINGKFKKTVQTFSYLPYFLSWVFVAGFAYSFFSDAGVVNSLLKSAGLVKEPALFMGTKISFLIIVVLTEVWKGFGWGSIIYLANISSFDIQDRCQPYFQKTRS